MNIRDRRFTLGIGIAAIALAVAAGAFALTGAFGIGPAAAEGGDDDGDRGAQHDRDKGDEGAALAEALGVTVEELEAAMRQVMLDRIDAAADAGMLTEERAETLREAIESGEEPGRGFRGHHGFGHGLGWHGDEGDEGAAFADALGVTVEELEAAMRQVMLDRIDAAADAGMLSDERAEALHEAIESGEEPGHGRGFRGHHGFGWHGDVGDEGAAFAEALGVTVEELEAAIRQVTLDRIDAAVEAGRLSEERAEMLREAIESGEPFERDRFDHGHRGRGFGFGFGFDGASADVLPEDLAERLRDLLEAVESGEFDVRDFGESFGIFRLGIAGGFGFDGAMTAGERQQAMLDRIDAAVEAGTLSEERADALRTLIETDDGEGWGGFGWPGRGFHRGHR